ncbi:hypothetical protein EON80_10770 [bacterium]|nr:MAG: hypothetical protein EON80_10770 [bacterium]
MIIGNTKRWEFRPEMLNGLVQYLDGEQTGAFVAATGLTASKEEPTSIWTPRVGGQGYSANPPQRPVLDVRYWGYKGLRFDGVDDRIFIDHLPEFATETVTVFCVAACDGQSQATAFRRIWGKGLAAAGARGIYYDINSSTTDGKFRVDSDALFNSNRIVPGACNGQPRVHVLRWGGGQYLGSVDNAHYGAGQNGALISNTEPFQLGLYANGGQGRSIIYAFLVYNRVLSDSEVALVTDYLQRRHGANRPYIINGAVLNGNFETLGSGGQVFANWTPQNSNAIITAVQGETGNYAAQLEHVNFAGSAAIQTNGSVVPSGRMAYYTLRARGSVAGLNITVNDGGLIPLTTSYQTYTGITTNYNAGYLTLKLTGQLAAGRSVIFDNVTLEDIP